MVNKQYNKSLFIFRRDLRLSDNTGLIQACKQSKEVLPLFNFDPSQVSDDNKYRSANCIQFMVESLKDLENQLKKKDGILYLFHDDAIQTIKKVIKNYKPDALFLNLDYTPYAIKRDKAIESLCKKNKIAFHAFHDALLIGDPSTLLTGSKTPYSVYSAFYKKASEIPVAEPTSFSYNNFFTGKISHTQSASIYKKIHKKDNPTIKVHGGRTQSLKILNNLKKHKNYAQERNIPAQDATTHLSASHKFGSISIRESYHAIKKDLGARTQLAKELYWRDFFTYVAFHNPRVFGHPYREKYDGLSWSTSKKNFQAWCEGKTGFPLVDAGMRELNATGWMHNRVRMVVASFLVKDLHINWLWGEQYFAQQLVDYDPSVNNGNWQWSASTGCDAQPYFRIFNPWTQQKRFDPNSEYIKKWIPELKKIDSKIINTWFKDTHSEIAGYPRPMLDHDTERKITLAHYRRA